MGKILDKLAYARVFQVFQMTPPGGVWRFEEDCDNYYHTYLTKQEMLELAEEIKALANETN